MGAVIRLKDIYYRYPNSDWVLKGINLSIQKGEYVVVCGASGSGKSTLAYLFNGLIPHFFGGTLRGSVTVGDVNTAESSVADLFQNVGLVLQNAEAQLFSATVEDEIAFGLESLGVPGPEIQKRILEIAELLGIEDLLDRTPTMLSGGEKRLVSIASILCLDPSVLLLDEPFANLDWAGAKRVREL
ncbi:MAG: ABC transporter ATP-binding protein, partial [Desulfobacteraceae bacterium]|nr:ABC transporter ATP-binding protein [Desulfobacteraceae bacterium]